MEKKKAYISRDNIGRKWVCCPYCHKRVILVTKGTDIRYMEYKCKISFCKGIFVVENINYDEV